VPCVVRVGHGSQQGQAIHILVREDQLAACGVEEDESSPEP